MLKQYKIYYVRYSDDTFQHFAAVNMEHALYCANLWIDKEYPKDYDIDIEYISHDTSISSLLILQSSNIK